MVALLACSKSGAICSPSLHRDHTTGEVVELMQRTSCVAFIWQNGYGADADKRDLIDTLKAVSTLRHIYQLKPLAETDKAPFAELAPARNDRAADKTDPNQIVYLAFTSGTTGKPKGVMHSDNTLLANARQLAKDWSIGNTSVVYTLSPLSHNLGFGAQVMALAMGAELVINDLPRGASLADRILETNTSFLVGVPPNAIDLLAEMQKRGLKGLGRLTGFRISGSAVPSEVVAGLIAQGIKPQTGYGMTEKLRPSVHHAGRRGAADHRDIGQVLRRLRASCLQGERSRHRSRNRRGRPARRSRREPDARLFRRSGRDGRRFQ